MAIPTEAAFNVSVGTLEKADAGYLRAAFSREILLKQDSGPAKQLIELALHARGQPNSKFNEDEVLSWLNSQEPFQRVQDRAWAAPGRSARVLSDAERVDRYYNALHKAVAADNHRGRMRLEDRLDILLGVHPLSFVKWLLRLVGALREYHYRDAPAKIVENRRQYSAKIDRAIAGLEAVLELTQDRAIVNRFQALQPYSQDEIPLVDENVQKRIEILKSLQNTEIDTMYPIARLDETAKERLFVLRLGRSNHIVWRKYRPADISLLMEMEGFRAQLDDRTIERLCSGFDKKTRRLYDEISGISVAA